MNNTIDNTKATPNNGEQKAPQSKITQKLGNTTYDVHIHFSKTSKETMTDKVMRLISNDKVYNSTP